MSRNDAYYALPRTQDGRMRTLALTGRGQAALSTAERVTPDSLFTPEQYDAIKRAGLDVFFVRADSLIGGAE